MKVITIKRTKTVTRAVPPSQQLQEAFDAGVESVLDSLTRTGLWRLAYAQALQDMRAGAIKL